jgi:hypothetical protein
MCYNAHVPVFFPTAQSPEGSSVITVATWGFSDWRWNIHGTVVSAWISSLVQQRRQLLKAFQPNLVKHKNTAILWGPTKNNSIDEARHTITLIRRQRDGIY